MSINSHNRRTLKFPNARLFVHNQLSCGRAAAEAIARSACEYGLLSHYDVVDVIPSTAAAAPCSCIATARNIISKYCKSKEAHTSSLNEAALWNVLEEDLTAYCEEAGGSPSESLKTPATGVNSHQCSHFAPILFDLMLQELLRHPG